VIALNTISSTHYFGLVKDSNSTNPGVLFKEVCKRENFTHQFPCILNNVPERPSVALIGDSHATQYSLILQQISQEMKFRLVMLGSIGGELDSTRTVAALMREKPEILIVSKFWLSSDFAKNSSFLESEDLLRKFSDKIIIVGQNPVFQNDDFVSATGGSALIDYIFNLDEGKSRVSHSRKFDGSAKVAGKSILKWAEFRNIRFIDPKLALCVDADCSNLASSSDYFFDNNHLSVIGAAKTKFLFKNALSNSLPNLN
jgi:hypothetical protein